MNGWKDAQRTKSEREERKGGRKREREREGGGREKRYS